MKKLTFIIVTSMLFLLFYPSSKIDKENEAVFRKIKENLSRYNGEAFKVSAINEKRWDLVCVLGESIRPSFLLNEINFGGGFLYSPNDYPVPSGYWALMFIDMATKKVDSFIIPYDEIKLYSFPYKCINGSEIAFLEGVYSHGVLYIDLVERNEEK